MVRKSQTLVTLNAKLSSVNLKTVKTDGSVVIAEGQPFKIGSTGYAATAETSSPDSASVVFLNFTASDRTDVTFFQGDPTDSTAPELGIEGGGLAGIVGNGCEVGLPAVCWHGGTLPTFGQYVKINGSSGLFAGTSATADDAFYGIIHQVTNGRAFFLFNSTPMVLQAGG
jgi:hypothetical protein